MTEQEYVDIAAACDRLLRAPDTSLARLAIPALHFLNEHPTPLAQYSSVFADGPDSTVLDVAKGLMRAARGVGRSLTARAAPLIANPLDVVIVSHLLRPEQLQRNEDFYFGALQRHLQDLGLRSLLVMINHMTPAPGGSDRVNLDWPRTILPGTVSPSTEADIWQQCAGSWRILRREAAAANGAVDRRLAMLATRQALSNATAVNLRMHAALAQLCQKLNPRIVVTTYEGTVAERLVWHAARTARRRPLCVGYQHAVVLKRAHAIRRPVAAAGIDCDPDAILTLGETPHALLAASPGLQSVRLIEYGSHRRASLPDLPPIEQRRGHCLVLPDANHEECAILFTVAIDCARRDPDRRFVLRPHPMVHMRSLQQRLPQMQNLPPNVLISFGKPLESEFFEARYCLYRGSSAALHAVRAGLKPYYLARHGELSFDCLSSLDEWREVVTSPGELLDRMRRADRSSDFAAARRAADSCGRYISAVRPAALRELLAMATPEASVARQPTLADELRDAARKKAPA